MSAKRFLVDSLTSALGVGLATPDDVMQHVTAGVLSEHLPRPLWSRLLAAALSAPRLDGALVVETIGVANLCEHIPAPVLFACVTDIAHRALGKNLVAPPPAPTLGRSSKSTRPPPLAAPMAAPLAPVPAELVSSAAVRATTLPAEDDISNLAASLGDAIDEALLPNDSSSRATTRSGMSTRPGASTRKPQSLATPPPAKAIDRGVARIPLPIAPPVRRGQTELETLRESDFGAEVETRVAQSPSENAAGETDIAIDDEQLVDWQPS
jgi:hypothetical protein